MTQHTEADDLHNPDVAHEHSDINVRAIVLFLAALTVGTAVAAAAMWGVFNVLDGMAKKNDPLVSPVATPDTQMPRRTTDNAEFGVAPSPRLLTNEPMALEKRHKEESELLEAGAWVDQGAGIGRIPIAEAKKALLHKGLPVRAGEPVDPRLGTHAAAMADSSSGRLAVVRQTPPAAAQQPQTQPPAPQEPQATPKKSGGH